MPAARPVPEPGQDVSPNRCHLLPTHFVRSERWPPAFFRSCRDPVRQVEHEEGAKEENQVLPYRFGTLSTALASGETGASPPARSPTPSGIFFPGSRAPREQDSQRPLASCR